MERKARRNSRQYFWALFLFGVIAIFLVNKAIAIWPRSAAFLTPVSTVALMLAVVGFVLGCATGLRLPPNPWFPAWCPKCQREGLRKLARARGNYFECTECKARLKWGGGDPEGSCWEDAGPEADKIYGPRSNSGRWTAYEPPRLDKSPLGKLLRSKWLRNRSGPIKPVAMAPPPSSPDSLHDPWLDG